jgi:hypothetical protein
MNGTKNLVKGLEGATYTPFHPPIHPACEDTVVCHSRGCGNMVPSWVQRQRTLFTDIEPSITLISGLLASEIVRG